MLWGAGLLLAIALGAVQTASLSIFKQLAVAPAFPAVLSPRWGEAIYRVLERAAPAPYVHDMLTRSAFDRRDYISAAREAERIAKPDARAEWLGRIALARGHRGAARAYFLQAGDAAAISQDVDAMAGRNLRDAIALESALRRRLARDGVHPDGVAEASWKIGVLNARAGALRRALTEYDRAVRLAPMNAKYLLSAGFAAYSLGLRAQARSDFRQAVDADPSAAASLQGVPPELR